MSHSEINLRSQIEAIFSQVLESDNIKFTDQLQARDVSGWNSLNHMRLIVEIEKKFGVNFKTKEVVALSNFGDLVRLVFEKISAQQKLGS